MSIRSPLVFATLFAVELLIGLAGPSVARAEDVSAMGCSQLWQRKNALLKSKGFCFQDARAIRTFGNDGCTIHGEARLPMTSADRELMARITLSEKMKLCR